MSISQRLGAFALFILSLIMLPLQGNGAEPQFKVPDFAYPQTVISEAEAMLAKADSGPVRLRALLELCQAQRLIDRNKIYAQPALVAAQLDRPGLDDASKAMMLCLEAQTYTDIYTSASYKYDRVDAPLEPYPADVAEWSGLQFRTRIASLLSQASGYAGDTPLAVYKDALDYTPEALTYMPSVADFVRYRRLKACNDLGRGGNEYAEQAVDVCREAIKASKEASAPFFYWSVALAKQKNSSQQQLYKELAELYSRFDAVEAARYVLGAMASISSRDDDDYERNDKLISLLRSSLEKFPGWYDNNSLQNSLNILTRPVAKVSLPNMVAPDRSFSADLSYSFAKNIEVEIHKVPYDLSNFDPAYISRRMPRAAYGELKTDKIRGKGKLTFRLTEPGMYAVVLKIDGVLCDERPTELEVSPIMAFALNGFQTVEALVVDFTTGAPLKDVGVNCRTLLNRKKSTSFLGKTNSDGILSFKAPEADRDSYHSRWLTFNYKGKTYSLNDNVTLQSYRQPDDSTTIYNCLLMTDRNIYHPGDSISWACVVGSDIRADKEKSVCAGMTLTVSLFDANYQKVESAEVTTDSFGRAYGAFATKKGVLTGNYRIQVNSNNVSESKAVMVSDFKAPVFETEVTSVTRDMPAAGGVTIEGKATTYSGMPVAAAKVSLTLKTANRWRWWLGNRTVGTLDAVTDDGGVFTVVVPAEMFEKAASYGDDASGDFLADITVTSATAETAETSKFFTIGKPYTFTVSCPDKADADKPLAVNVKAYDANGKSFPLPFTWKIVDSAKSVGLPFGIAKAGEKLDIDLNALAAGVYSLEITPADTTLANTVKSGDVLVYSIKRNAIPAAAGVYMVVQDRVVREGNSVKLTVGSNVDKLYLYSIVCDGKTLVPMKLYTLGKGFSDIKVHLPEGAEDTDLHLMAVSEGNKIYRHITVTYPEVEKTEVVAESFRDRLVPGAGETWRIRLSRGGSAIAGTAFVATMYDHALDALANGSWPDAFRFYSSRNYCYVSGPNVMEEIMQGNLPLKHLQVSPIEWPGWKFIGYGSSYMSNSIRIRGNRSMKAMATATADAADMEESVEYELAEDIAVAPEEAAGAGNTGGEAAPKEEYREAEVLQAFWKPELVADGKGNVDIMFTVPNANTTWQFKAFGWSKTLDAASYAARAVASKPVMVQPNMPRFLRQGDKATVLADIFNNTDSTAVLTSTVEIFDLATGKVLERSVSTDTVAPKASAIASIQVQAPTDAAAIGYRVRAVAGAFADGEQSAIPVLRSAATVIESTEFYLNPDDSKPFELTVNAGDKASVSLQYIQNPVWTLVKAMRGIAAGESKTSTGIVSHLFSALAAKHIVDSNPDVAKAIAQWRDNPSEEALVSMLEKNENLKKLMLDSTPWVQAAQSNSTRMAALADFLDPDRCAKAIADMTTALSRQQNADGGIRWGSWSEESSEWSTEIVLTTMGIARSLGIDMSAFDSILQPAFAYLQKQVTKEKRPATDHGFTLVASYFPDYKQSVAGSKIVRNTIAEIVKNWKNSSSSDKAYDIIILAANGRKTEAAAVLESLRQFAVVKPGMGLCFPNVSDIRAYATIIQAYAAMDASKAEIDAMRQWITVQAQALDNLGACNPDYIISAVMLTGSDWTSAPVGDAVTINGKALPADAFESSTGYISQTIAADGGRTVITILPNGVTPSYGSIVKIDSQTAASVKARPGRDLSIEKRFLVQRDGAWVETTAFVLGERVRVQLTVKAGRNLQYATIDDERAATLAPVDQLPGFVWDGSLVFYRENLDASTRLFIGYLPAGTYHVTYDMTAAAAGSFTSGIATLQSQYAPELTAHSAGSTVTVE